MRVRRANTSDAPRLLHLMGQLGYPQDSTEFQARMASFLESVNNGVALVEEGGTILGWVAWSHNLRFVVPGARLRVDGLVVDQAHRGRGIGRALMEYLEIQARATGANLVELTSGLRRESDGAHAFYRKLGYGNEGPLAKVYLRKTL